MARIQDIERLGDEWGAGLVHRSCAVLGGITRPAERRKLGNRHSARA